MTKTMKRLKMEERELVRALAITNSLVEQDSYKGLLDAVRMMINREDRR